VYIKCLPGMSLVLSQSKEESSHGLWPWILTLWQQMHEPFWYFLRHHDWGQDIETCMVALLSHLACYLGHFPVSLLLLMVCFYTWFYIVISKVLVQLKKLGNSSIYSLFLS
jgi:hypothetical protein